MDAENNGHGNNLEDNDMGMDAEKAKEIVAKVDPEKGVATIPGWLEWREAEGYLAALQGPEVSSLRSELSALKTALEEERTRNWHEANRMNTLTGALVDALERCENLIRFSGHTGQHFDVCASCARGRSAGEALATFKKSIGQRGEAK